MCKSVARFLALPLLISALFATAIITPIVYGAAARKPVEKPFVLGVDRMEPRALPHVVVQKSELRDQGNRIVGYQITGAAGTVWCFNKHTDMEVGVAMPR